MDNDVNNWTAAAAQ